MWFLAWKAAQIVRQPCFFAMFKDLNAPCRQSRKIPLSTNLEDSLVNQDLDLSYVDSEPLCLLKISSRSNSQRINNFPLDLLWSGSCPYQKLHSCRSNGAAASSIAKDDWHSHGSLAFANYRSCRASSTGSMRTQFLVGTTASRIG